LIEGLRSEVIVRDPTADTLLPIPRTPFATAVRRALDEERARPAESVGQWLHRLPGRLGQLLRDWLAPPVLRDECTRTCAAPPDTLFATATAIGGPAGWYGFAWAGRLRGAIDQLLGGPGLDPSRPRVLAPGGRLDVWRAIEVDPPLRLRLEALLKLPGRAELELVVLPRADGSVLVQTVRFAPRGPAGYLYWYGLYPMHALVFGGMSAAIVRRAERGATTEPAAVPSPALTWSLPRRGAAATGGPGGS
jgi:hypothetical protein